MRKQKYLTLWEEPTKIQVKGAQYISIYIRLEHEEQVCRVTRRMMSQFREIRKSQNKYRALSQWKLPSYNDHMQTKRNIIEQFN